jgi:type II secretory ATPase GspE/PulE/Tfp pilus assembly ATPase PilB-like protein
MFGLRLFRKSAEPVSASRKLGLQPALQAAASPGYSNGSSGEGRASAPPGLNVHRRAEVGAGSGLGNASPSTPSTSNASVPANALPTSVFADLRFMTREIETQLELAEIVFHEVINESVRLGQHVYSRIAIARISAASKTVVLFVDKVKVTADDVRAVIELLRSQGYEFPESGPQGYYLISTLVISLSQRTLVAQHLATDRKIARDPSDSSLMASFTDIVSWAYTNSADDIDFAVDNTSVKSQIAFKIGGAYVRPERHLLPTDTLIQMLGIAWEKSGGGGSAQFQSKTEQQCQITLELPRSQLIPNGARVRLRWSGMANDKGTVVTMRLQRLGAFSQIPSLEAGGYPQTHVETLRRVIHSEGGMCVIAGVVGSGKTTALAQLIGMLPHDIKIQSIEDPVELDIPRAYQKTVSRDLTSIGVDPSFVAATRALFRSAMDVLYLGEIRDMQTGMVARSVVESGHSVYTTTHARSALGIVDRFASPEIGIPRTVLATPDILKLLVYQALLKRNCPHCCMDPSTYAREFKLVGADLNDHHTYFERLHRLFNIEPDQFRMRNHHGCPMCRKTDTPELDGFAGRTVVAEMVEPDEQMLEYILVGNNIELNRYWRSLASPSFTDSNLVGKNTMECAIFKAAQGTIDPRVIEPRFMRFETLERKLKSRGSHVG